MPLARRRRRQSLFRAPGSNPVRGAFILFGMMLGLLVLAGCLIVPREPSVESFAPEGPAVRVLLLNDVAEVTLTVDGQTRRVSAGDVGAQPITFRSSKGEPIVVNSKRDAAYRGQIRVSLHDGALDVVNVVSVEEYLLGVVTRESPARWPIETLKAQAIASRTYALFHVRMVGRSVDRGFDLFDDTRSQVYGGYSGETDESRRAVKETSGSVLAYGPRGREKIFQAYFSSTCGGITASSADVFPQDDIPPLRERLADGCTSASRYRWSATVPKQVLTERVRAWARAKRNAVANMSTLQTVEPSGKNALGRPTRYHLVDDRGTRYELTAEQARSALGWDAPRETDLHSGFFEVTDAGSQLKFDGRGFGHGVGYCQWCGNGWGRAGVGAVDILKRSYPGAVLVRAY
jgi:stage II sporulation protein D